MKTLPMHHFYCQEQIACRFLRSPSKNEPLVITIPGGPGLSGNYLDNFLIDLAQHANINVGIMDLPNHGESVLSLTKLPLTYKNCFDLTNSMLNELAQQAKELILFGQSFGARLAFDLLAFSHTKIIGGFLTAFPQFYTSLEKNK
jgi:pimeloyl-ACP methyl ester carboxylesterase